MIAFGRLLPSLLKENIFFVVTGTFASTLCVLFFDTRFYSMVEILLLFFIIFLSFIVQSFLGSLQPFLQRSHGLLLYLKSLAVNLALLSFFYAFLYASPIDILLTLKFCLLVTFLGTSIYFFTLYQKQFERLREKGTPIGPPQKLQQVKELEVLKQQIDPHFIFNSFNTLAFLIDQDKDKAKQFSGKLANVHRYILFNSNVNLVSLADEIGFSKDYAYLQEVRHSQEVQIQFDPIDDADNIFILPVSIQVLIENAIKHNTFSETQPLKILIRCENHHIVVENNRYAKNYDIPSSKIGLNNLRDRCRLILGKDLQVEKSEALFRVAVPLLTQ